MKIAILHLSDFHVYEGEHFLREKINKFLDSLNVLGNVSEFLIVFSGDLASTGKINEYKSSRYIIGQIIDGIKKRHDKKFIDLFMVPGNHDLSLTESSRTFQEIQKAYENETIEDLIPNELNLLNNFFTYSHANSRNIADKILDRRFCTYNDEYKIQFNLINTALFSTLQPDDKELHYFPKEKISLLKKQADANICITIMHHSYEWFNWRYQTDLEKAIVNNSEFLFTGHDHCEKALTISIDNSMDTWVSCAGEMKFSDINYSDSFNALLVDTDSNTFMGYIYNWNSKERIYVHKLLVENKHFQNRTSYLMPLSSYLRELKYDEYNSLEDFTKYFVFPKLVSIKKDEFGKYTSISNSDGLLAFINENKRISVLGSSDSGKSTLLKHLYLSLIPLKAPLFFSIDASTKIKTQKLIKRLFEDQYGDDPLLYTKYQQLHKDEKALIIDGWDRLDIKSQTILMQLISENFSYIIISENNTQKSIIDSVKEEIDEEQSFHQLKIKPFFAEKRNQLVRNICLLNSSSNNEDIDKVNKLIDSIILNNNTLFSLNPGFIIRYTDYFIKDSSYDYTKGEAIFSKIFEHGINSAIIDQAKKADVDEIITAFEELAGYIFTSREDILKIEDFRIVVELYNEEYSVNVNPNEVLDIGIKSKILRTNADLSVYFSNKNYLAYFIAKYLLRMSQSVDSDYSGIEYALRNICFGINSDIILFISYLSNNTKTVMSISEQAGALLSPLEEYSFEDDRFQLLKNLNPEQISAPSKEHHDELKKEKEKFEEEQYTEDVIEAKGLFTYNEDDIDKHPYRLVRAIKYTEMLCKALPSFNSMLKRTQKESLISSIYSYPHKIVFALLDPVDKNLDKVCDELLALSHKIHTDPKIRKRYTKEYILDMINDHARAIVLSIYDHFAELCTSAKTINLLCEKEITGINQWLQVLMIKENSGNTEAFLKEAENMLYTLKDERVKNMVRLVVRKHLLSNPELPHNKRQQIVDKFLGQRARKLMLLPKDHE